MGRNGSGKTTLLRCVAGVHEPAGGGVVHRRPPAAAGRRCRPMSPRSRSIPVRRDGGRRDPRFARGPGPARHTRCDPGEVRDRGARRPSPRDLSAGQRLLVATAATVAAGAPVLLLDEPARGVDPETKALLAGFCGGTRRTAAPRSWRPTTSSSPPRSRRAW
ncbi:MAG: ABC transporter ATP-binding protein [Actinomycetota bacterium]